MDLVTKAKVWASWNLYACGLLLIAVMLRINLQGKDVAIKSLELKTSAQTLEEIKVMLIKEQDDRDMAYSREKH